MSDDTIETPTAEQLAAAIELLERVAEDRGLLTGLSTEDKHRFLRAVGRIAAPPRNVRKQMVRAERARERLAAETRRATDEQLLAATGIRTRIATRRRKASAPPRPFDPPPAPRAEPDPSRFGPRLNEPRSCYVCKTRFDRLHFFYDSLCADCAELNWDRRNQTADLTGRYALVTGGRVKIGYEAALKLLRAGAHVVVTTRFPRDGAARFCAEADSDEWSARLRLHGLDLRHTPGVEAFASGLRESLPRLDFILNNACQTVRRPPGFYAHLIEGERAPLETLPAAARRMLAEGPPDVSRAAELSQVPLLSGDSAHGPTLFPAGRYDEDVQQVDLRAVNSWRLGLADVPTVELLEVQLVNAIAPFILNARLKPLMLRVPTPDKHIVNVSAMEGVFYRANKTDKHPHTNMAKAALNMLTRTSARDYIADGIHMNSIDTGWITDEDPAPIARRKREELGFHPPLDTVDAAARICDPIFHGLLTGNHVWGQFLKNYQIANW